MKQYRKDAKVDDYINALPDWQQTICREVRDLVHSDEEVREVIKRTIQPYFILDGNICALLAAKTHVNIFIYDPTVADPSGIINQGHNNLTAKSIQISEGESINQEALLEMFKSVIANNRVGGWRKLNK